MKKIPALKHVRTIALIVVLIGAGGSLGLVLHAGRNNDSVLLLSLFVVWVLSPFMALLVANVISRHWAAFTRAILYCLVIVVASGSLISYSGVLSPPGTKTAFVFLVVPLVSWLLMVIVIPMAASLSRRLSRKSNST